MQAVKEINADLEQREAARLEQEDEHVRAEADIRFANWLDGMRRRFADEAREKYREAHPVWTFERVADIRLQKSPNLEDPARRAAYVADLAAVREEQAK